MAVKRRFKPKQDKVNEFVPKPNKEAKSNVIDFNQSKMALKSADYKDQQLIILLRINELLQDDKLSLKKLTEGILDIISQTLGCVASSLWLYQDETSTMVCKVARGPSKEKVEGVKVPLGKGIVGWVAEKKRSTIVYDTSKDTRFSITTDTSSGFQTKSLITAPLLYRTELVGAIQVINPKSGRLFNDADQDFLNEICSPVAMHIKNVRMARQQGILLQRFTAIEELHSLFCSTMDLNSLLGMVLERIVTLSSAEVGSLWLLEEHGEGIECQNAEGPTKDQVIGVKLKRGSGFVGWVIDNKKPIIIEDCKKDKRFSAAMDKKTGFETKSMMCAPLLVKNEVIGAVQVINKRGKDDPLFNEEDLTLLSVFAGTSASYIKNARLFAAETKAKELAAIIEISHEITSTLDLDSVLMTIVNLSSQVIPYEEASISLESRVTSKMVVHAISETQDIDRESEAVKKLTDIHNIIAETNKTITVNNQEEISKLELGAKFTSEITEYLTSNGYKSFYATPLSDDQGLLGIIVMNSNDSNAFGDNRLELLEIIKSQATVTLRNSMLYTTIPMTSLREKISHKIGLIKKIKLRSLAISMVALAVVALSLIFIKTPYRVDANIEIIPAQKVYYSPSNGNISRILVKEGGQVEKGTPLATLDVKELILEKQIKTNQILKVQSEMRKFHHENKIVDYKTKEHELIGLKYELELIQEKIVRSKIVSNEKGVVTSSNLEELIGKPVSYGQEILKIAREREMYVRFEVDESDIPFLKPGQEAKFRLFSDPINTYGHGVSIYSINIEATEAEGSDEAAKSFYAMALISNIPSGTGSPKAGMSGKGKIYTEDKPLWWIIFRKPLGFLAVEVFF